MPHPLSSHWVKRLTIFFSSTGPGCILARVGEIRGGEGEGEVWGQLSKEDKGGAAGAVTDFRLLDGEKCYFLLKSWLTDLTWRQQGYKGMGEGTSWQTDWLARIWERSQVSSVGFSVVFICIFSVASMILTVMLFLRTAICPASEVQQYIYNYDVKILCYSCKRLHVFLSLSLTPCPPCPTLPFPSQLCLFSNMFEFLRCYWFFHTVPVLVNLYESVLYRVHEYEYFLATVLTLPLGPLFFDQYSVGLFKNWFLNTFLLLLPIP